jgi:hypothetical protein
MFLFSPRWLLFYPGLFLLLIGGSLFLRLLAGPITVGGVCFDLNTLEVASLVMLLGYQMMLFAVFARIFCFTRNLLPAKPWLTRIFDFITLEKGLISGGLITLAGIGVILYAAFGWASTGFGNLDPFQATRTVIAGRSLISFGLQTILFSLIFSYLGMDDAPSRTPEP